MESEPKAVDRKSYRQACTVAVALDVLGDRWTILLLRELLGGPSRFQDLKHGLNGIAPNLLADRLRRLEADGLIRKSSGNGVRYALTELGADTRPLVEALGFFGGSVSRIAPPTHERSIRALSVALQAILVRSSVAVSRNRATIELEIDGDHAEIVLGSEPSVSVRPSLSPNARVSSSTEEMSRLLRRELQADKALRHIDGNPELTEALIAALR